MTNALNTVTIPPAAAEALSDAVADLIGERLSLYEARAACLAMLENWEGMKIHGDTYTNPPRHNIIIPLTEPSDDNDLRRAAHINAKKLVPSDRAALREKVASAINLWVEDGMDECRDAADAAIAVALEEAAKVAGSRARFPSTGNRVHDSGWDGAAISISAAIRAMKRKD
jgi:hypothetical protein